MRLSRLPLIGQLFGKKPSTTNSQDTFLVILKDNSKAPRSEVLRIMSELRTIHEKGRVLSLFMLFDLVDMARGTINKPSSGRSAKYLVERDLINAKPKNPLVEEVKVISNPKQIELDSYTWAMNDLIKCIVLLAILNNSEGTKLIDPIKK